MRFLYESERAWIGAGSFERALKLLGVPIELYKLEIPGVYSPEEIDLWLDSLENDLRETNLKGTEAYAYLENIILALRRWTERGYVIHVSA